MNLQRVSPQTRAELSIRVICRMLLRQADRFSGDGRWSIPLRQVRALHFGPDDAS